jgi:hypothetical protein
MSDAPKIQIDSDWKAEAQKEKERLARKEHDKPKPAPRAGADADAAGETGEREPLPPADFHTLVGMLAQQAIMGLGVMADRKTGGVIVDLEGSRFSIDLLDVLQQKTKGNLSPEEDQELTQILGDLRARFVQIATLVSQQMSKQGAGGVAVAPATAIPGASPIITE